MPEEMKLYEELHEDVRFHLNSLLADKNVSNPEIAAECEKMAEILSMHAFHLIAIRDDPVMLPVYGLMCQMICNTINKVMTEEVQQFKDKVVNVMESLDVICDYAADVIKGARK